MGSGSEQRERDDRDAIGSAAGEFPCVDDDPVDQPVADLVVEPVEVLDIVIVDGVGQLPSNGWTQFYLAYGHPSI